MTTKRQLRIGLDQAFDQIDTLKRRVRAANSTLFDSWDECARLRAELEETRERLKEAKKAAEGTVNVCRVMVDSEALAEAVDARVKTWAALPNEVRLSINPADFLRGEAVYLRDDSPKPEPEFTPVEEYEIQNRVKRYLREERIDAEVQRRLAKAGA